jgi:putative ABC transport system substrate-binding protein
MKLHSAYSGYRGEAVAKSLRRPLTDLRQFDILQSGPGLPAGDRMQFYRLNRREFITLLGSAAAAWPLAARAQQPVFPKIGFLSVGSPEAFGAYVSAFRQGLGQVGYFEGRNLSIEFRWARGQYDRLAALASELVGQRIAILASNGGARSALAAKAATTNIPIVFIFGDGDPVAYGLVRSFNEPGGNVTGITMIAGLLEPKRLEILRELLPGVRLVYLLINPNNAGAAQDLPSIVAAAGPLGIKLEVVKASTENEIDAAFSIITRERAQALMVHERCILAASTEPNYRAMYPTWPASNLPLARVCGSGWVNQLWSKHP